MAPENIAAFVGANLSADRFAEYLADPQRTVLTATHDDRIIGYAMLIRGSDDDVELSKIYVAHEHHGTGVATALMDLALATAGEWGAGRVWLGSTRPIDARNASIPGAASRSAAPESFGWAPATRTTSS